MSPNCPPTQISIPDWIAKVESYGLTEHQRFTGLDIPEVFKGLKRVPEFAQVPVREGVELLISYVGSQGAVMGEFIKGCAQYVYFINPDTYMNLIEGLGKAL